ncbi:MAG TPA: hypothetical protein VMV94_05345 [Phycisphaerae bacterium]|nr:hypothetical protein [Phycisphaerae bacterium]
MSSVRIDIDDDLKAFLEAQAGQHGYSSVGEYLRALLREVQQRQTAERAAAVDGANGTAPWEIALSIGAAVPQEAWDNVPTDLSKNIDHYLYGSPRED